MSQISAVNMTGGTGIVDTLTGNTGGAVPPTSGNINVVGSGALSVAGNPGTSTLTISASGAVPTSFVTDAGTATPAAGIINFKNAAANQGTLRFNGSGSTVDVIFTDANFNTGLGIGALVSITTGQQNSAFGESSLGLMSTFNGSSAYGAGSLSFSTQGPNDAFGENGLGQVTTGQFNVGFGNTTLGNVLTGSRNTALGNEAGSGYTGADSDNISIGYHAAFSGVAGESNVLRIGNATGTGVGNLAKTFIAGIQGVNVGSVATVVSMVGDQLGSTTITAGSGIVVVPGANTITISTSGLSTLAYTNVNSSPYVVLPSDEYLSVDSSGGPITVQLPNAATLGRTFVVKDRTGSANTNNITITTVGGAVNIDGATTYVMNTQFAAIQIIGNGSTYEIY